MTEIKVIIAGGRNFIPSIEANMWLDRKLNAMKEIYDNVTIISGGAKGADKFGEDKAKELGLHCIVYPAKWDIYGKTAGFKRNEQMAQIANACILFPGGNGTADMEKRAYKHNLIIYKYKESDIGASISR